MRFIETPIFTEDVSNELSNLLLDRPASMRCLVSIRLFGVARVRSAAFRPPRNGITLGLTMTRLLVLCAMLLAATAEASQDWELISVTRGATWEVNQARGALKHNGKVLEGVLKDRTDGQADYQIRIELDGGHAKATFRFISEQDSGTTLTGFYAKAAKPTKTHCPEQIQLMNAFQYIGLARDACEP